jgi:hypothetical protein
MEGVNTGGKANETQLKIWECEEKVASFRYQNQELCVSSLRRHILSQMISEVEKRHAYQDAFHEKHTRAGIPESDEIM